MASGNMTVSYTHLLVKEVFDGKAHKFVVNFLCILTENDRLPDFERILAYFTELYNEKLGIADVTVTLSLIHIYGNDP